MTDKKNILAIIILIIAMFFLTQKFELGGESWDQWASARILKDTGGFPTFSQGPLYVVYLYFLSFLDYPLSMQLEYLITHLFAYVSIYFMLQTFIQKRYALPLTIAWIPRLAVLEPAGMVAGIGFVSLYFSQVKKSKEAYLPITLLVASLIHTAFVPFLAGHIVGVLIKIWKDKKPLRTEFNLEGIAKITLVVFAVIVAVFPSTYFNNHMLIDTEYIPIPLKDPITIGFFQVGNYLYADRTFPESEQIYQDWYFTHEEAFGNASTILEAIINKPGTVVKNIATTMRLGVQAPVYFFVGKFLGLFSLLFWIIPLFGFISLVQKSKDNIPFMASITLGTIVVFGGLTLTGFGVRYMTALLPVSLLLLCHMKKYTKYMVVISSILVLVTMYPAPQQIMAGVHEELFESINKSTKVLALENQWIMGFTDVDLGNIYQVWSLPPFEDTETEKILSDLDVIWVSSEWKTERPSRATQSYLRYKLHVKPFLEKKIGEGEWTVKTVEGYGKIYKKEKVTEDKNGN